jgi:hypothetical protein
VSKIFVDEIWVQDQLDGAGIDKPTQDVVKTLLSSWDGMEVPDNLQEGSALATLIETFATLAQGHGLRPVETEEVWVPVQRGFVHTGDEVRVRHDAFDGKVGLYHNGRRGKVVAVRSGDIVFRSTDTISPPIDGARYQPDKLERRVL